MPNENRAERSRMEKLRHNYRLVVMNDETFEEVGSYRLSLLNVYIIICAIVVGVALIVGSLIWFTPIHQYIPGFGSLDERKMAIKALEEVETLKEQLTVMAQYNDNMRRRLTGDIQETAENVENAAVDIEADEVEMINPIEEDQKLRNEVAMQERQIEEELLARTANFIPSDVPIEQMYFTPPVTGLVGAPFSAQKNHYGIDILAPQNTPIKSVMDGYVFISDWTLETGHTIGIQHSNNIVSFYKHNSALLKKVGNYVKAGEAVAIIGNTGELSDGPHLHFELWHNGKAINPSTYIIFE